MKLLLSDDFHLDLHVAKFKYFSYTQKHTGPPPPPEMSSLGFRQLSLLSLLLHSEALVRSLHCSSSSPSPVNTRVPSAKALDVSTLTQSLADLIWCSDLKYPSLLAGPQVSNLASNSPLNSRLLFQTSYSTSLLGSLRSISHLTHLEPDNKHCQNCCPSSSSLSQ